MNTIESKQKALKALIQRIKDNTASDCDIRNYDKLKKLGVII